MHKLITIDSFAPPELKETAVSTLLSYSPRLQVLYPNFDIWATEKVANGLQSGTRKIIVSFTDHQISGFAVIKDELDEKKLCCLRVAEEYQNRYGIGDKLFKMAFDVLDTDRPLLSVSEDMLPSYAKMFAHYGFKLECSYPDYYKPKKTEFCYNGELTANPVGNMADRTRR